MPKSPAKMRTRILTRRAVLSLLVAATASSAHAAILDDIGVLAALQYEPGTDGRGRHGGPGGVHGL